MSASQPPGPSGPPQEAGARLLSLLAPFHDQARRSARRLCRCNSDGDDLFQEAVLRALQRLGDLRDEGRFRPWFFAVLLSVHRQRARRDLWRRFLPFGDQNQTPERQRPAAADPEDLHGGAARMALALSRLPAEQREAVVLFSIEGFSIEELAELQRTSPSAVKTRLSRGRARLRAIYEELIAAEERQSGAAPAPAVRSGHGRATF